MQAQEWQTVAQQLTQQMATMQQQLGLLLQQQQYQAELFAEMTPILKEVMAAGTTKLQELEEKGYFAFVREMMGVMEQVVGGFSPEDIKQLGQNIVGILNTVRSLTQPDILQILNQAAEPIHHPEQVQSMGFYGMVKASRDEDVRRGFGVMLEVLRQVGRGVTQRREHSVGAGNGSMVVVGKSVGKGDAMRAKLAPKRKEVTAPVVSQPASPVSADKTGGLDGFDAEGYLLDPDRWSKELAQSIAQSVGVSELTEDHWRLLEFARADFKETGKSPNIRRITVGLGIDTKRVYQLFPSAPGRSISKIAGIPKPGGCL